MAEQRLIDANKEVIRAYEDIPEPYSDVLISFLRGCETIDPESLPIVQQLREALSIAVAEKEAAEALLAEYSGVGGCKTIKTCFGYPLDKVQQLVEADKAAKLQRAAKGEMSMVTLHEAIEHAREVSRCGCTECHKEHGQLADWLEELERSRAELAEVKAERDEAVNDCSGRCETCAFESDCVKHDNNDTSAGLTWHYGCEEWEWRGLQKVDCKKEGDSDESAQKASGERLP